MENPTPDGMFQLVVTAAETLILIPNGVRQIFTDGRGHPCRDNLWPTLLGDSVGT